MASKKEKEKVKEKEKEREQVLQLARDVDLIGNHFQLAIAVSRRARQLTNGSPPLVAVRPEEKNTMIALQEFKEKKWKIVMVEGKKKLVRNLDTVN